jgi:hypothetical protein
VEIRRCTAMPYIVEELALHLVNRKKYPSAQCSNIVQSVAGLSDEVKNFLDEHVEMLCSCGKDDDTNSTNFEKNSVIKTWYDDLMANRSDFLKVSQDLAQRLFEVSDDRTSPGLLMVLLFRSKTPSRKFLGLFKLDPFEESLIQLDHSAQGLYAINVAKIMEALPRANSNRVLKCAVIRHPTSDEYDLKFRDNQSKGDPAQYFGKFLGCQVGPSEKTQVRKFIKGIEKYLKEHKSVVDWSTKAPALIGELARQSEPITFDTFKETVRNTGLFSGRDEREVEEILSKKVKPGELYIPKESASFSNMAYNLSNDIVIRGPIDRMLDFVEITSQNGKVIFKIESDPDYKITYD